MMDRSVAEAWPPLPLAEWKDTLATLHMWLQIVGKVRLSLAPHEDHWWQVALYLTPRGLTTSTMPCGSRSISVDLDFIDHVLVIQSSDGGVEQFALSAYPVSEFYARFMRSLHALDIAVTIDPRPVEVETAIRFEEDDRHAQYDPVAVNKCWRILSATDRVMKRFRGRFRGKQSPSHFFWGSFDMAVTRFSGKAAPRHPGGAPHCRDEVMVEAYSHECASCGFWPGGGALDQPAFYAYTYPVPPGYESTDIQPAGANSDAKAGEFILPYDAVRTAPDPEAALLMFFQSAYEGAAGLEGWDRETLDRPVAAWP